MHSPPMARSTITFVCTECGGESLRWAGQCPHCRAWNTLQEYQVRKAPRDSKSSPVQRAPVVPLTEIGGEDAQRTRLAWGELNRVLGGGIVPGSLVLIGGEPGVGKSTLLMQAASVLAERMAPVLYVTAEESAAQVKLRADRLGVGAPELLLWPETDLSLVQAELESVRPGVLIVDSI